MGPLPFEIQGAEAARKLLLTAGLDARTAEVVWDAIAMHPLAISGFKRPEIALVAAGASADVFGVDLDKVDSSKVAEVLVAFPRLAFKREFAPMLTSFSDTLRAQHAPSWVRLEREKSLILG
jgi:hypothetical protein